MISEKSVQRLIDSVPGGYELVTSKDKENKTRKGVMYWRDSEKTWATTADSEIGGKTFLNNIYCQPIEKKDDKMSYYGDIPEGYSLLTDEDRVKSGKLPSDLFWSEGECQWKTPSLRSGFNNIDIYIRKYKNDEDGPESEPTFSSTQTVKETLQHYSKLLNNYESFLQKQRMRLHELADHLQTEMFSEQLIKKMREQAVECYVFLQSPETYGEDD